MINSSDSINIKNKLSDYVELISSEVDDVVIEWFPNYVQLSTSNTDMLAVSIYYSDQTGNVGINIQGVDTDYWHSGETLDLSLFIDCAIQALNGNYSRNRSPILRFEEICFPIKNHWHCTRTDTKHRLHYVRKRNKI